MRRVSVVGTSGSGKSTFAQALAARLGVPHVELDGLFHQADWQPLPADEFRATVEQATAGDGWVVDGNYSAVRELVWSQADTVVWVDPSRPTLMRQLIRRTLGRMLLRRELWNGNRERLRTLFSRDPNVSLIVYAWGRFPVIRVRYTAAMTDPTWSHVTFVRIRSRADAARLLSSAAAPSTQDPPTRS